MRLDEEIARRIETSHGDGPELRGVPRCVVERVAKLVLDAVDTHVAPNVAPDLSGDDWAACEGCGVLAPDELLCAASTEEDGVLYFCEVCAQGLERSVAKAEEKPEAT